MSAIPTPPVSAERMLAWCLRRDPAGACIVGDLRQEYAALARSHSRARARRWYWAQVVVIGMRCIGRRTHQPVHAHTRRRNGTTIRVWDVTLQNLSYAFRGLRRSPGFSAAVILTLALGIGANATMFGVVDRLLLSPPQHLVDAGQLRLLSLSDLGQRSVNSPRAYSFPDYRAIRHHALLESAAAYSPPRRWTMNAGADARKVLVQQATASLFPTLGVLPLHGRFYTAEHDVVGAPLTAVLSHEFWGREFGRDPEVLGQMIELSRGRYEVIGVAPAGFTGAELRAVDVWIPIEPSTAVENGWAVLDSRGGWWWRVVVRLKKGSSDDAVDAQLTAAHNAGVTAYLEQGGEPHSDSMGGRVHTGSVIAARGPNASTTTTVSLWLAGVSLFVLLIACANVANLLLARGIQMRRELAIRVALGVDRRRLLSQLLTEATVLAGVGALAALIVARWSSRVMHAALIPGVSFTDTGMDGRLLLFVSAATAVTALLAGLLPALQASRTSPGDVLHHSARGNTDARSSLRDALMVGQVALSVVLLIGAGLFVKSLSQAAEADLGFDHNRIVVVQIEGIPDMEREQRDQLYRAALSRINGLPGVHTAVLASETIPLWGYNEQHEMRVRGMDSIPRVPGGGPYTYSGTEGFVEALGLEIVRGRSFTSGEYRTGAELVVMVSESFVRTIWPGRDPMVECVILEHGAVERDGPEPCRSVVGVYKDIAVRSLADASGLSVTWPTPPESTRLGGIIVRAGGDPLNLVRSIREQVHAISADVRFVRVNLISDRVDGLLGPWKLGATMFTAFGVLALVVAAVGLYSVLSFGVAQRQRELGIRAALGARRQDLMRMIMGQAARFVSMGLALGAAIALATGRFIDSLLFGVEASDPSVYGLVIITLFVAGAAAALVPAWRATSVNPTTAIQAE